MKIHVTSLALLVMTYACQTEDRLSYVDPNIGSIAPLLTTLGPTVHRPNSMVRVFPITKPGLSDRYFSDKIYGFPLNIPAYRDHYVSSLLPVPDSTPLNPESMESLYDHSVEECHPWYHHVFLQDFSLDAEWTTTEHAVLYRFGNQSHDNFKLIFRLENKGEMEFHAPDIIEGWETFHDIRQYFYIILSETCTNQLIHAGDSLLRNSKVQSDHELIAELFFKKLQKPLELRIGISYISRDQARENVLLETKGKSFENICDQSKKIWDKALGKIEIEGGTERERRIFYTSLYRTFERMVCISEYGKYFSGFDFKVHSDSGVPFYTDDWLWDTFRSLHPLMTILDPDKQVLMLKSYIRMYEQSGWMPLFPQVYGDMPAMLGNHSAALFADAYAKGLKEYDLEKAYEGIRKNALEGTLLPWKNGPKTDLDDFYTENGWFPALPPDAPETNPAVHPWEKRQAVAVSMEQCLDDACTSILAKALGKNEDAALFEERSQNYRKVFNPATGFVSPKNEKGEWIKPFDPTLSAWYGSRMYFAENNSWIWTWNVTEDIPGLIELMGGPQAFSKRLDELFNTPPHNGKWMFMGQFPDATGLQGMYVAGNEPSFHIPYLYNYCGESWKTQRRIRQVMDVWFDDRPSGLPGDEDGGAMCAWYVFSAMGFYPVTPGSAIYAIGSPVFSKITIHLPDGKIFMVEAKDASKVNQYIQTVSLNGKPLQKLFFTHQDLMEGGTLKLSMGPKPVMGQ